MRQSARTAFARVACAALLGLSPIAPARAESAKAPGRWIGRADETGQRFAWPGSGLAFRFEGRRLTVRLANEGENSLVATIDGLRKRIDLAPGEKTYTLFDGPAGPHAIELRKRTEGDVGLVRFLGAETDGRFLKALTPERRILVIGDSISAGYGIEGAGPNCSFSPDTQNQTLTYAAQVAERFGAETVTLAASGRGLVRNYSGAREGTMPDLMDRALPNDPSLVGAARGPFDLVLVHLGTNDFSGSEEPYGFETAYAALLETLRARYPSAPIYALIGPMLGPDRLDLAKAGIENALTRRQKAGDRAVGFLAFPAPPSSYGCDWHPSVAANRRMADLLAARLESDLGW